MESAPKKRKGRKKTLLRRIGGKLTGQIKNKQVRKVLNNGINKLDRHPAVKGAIATVLAAGLLQGAGAVIDTEYQVVQVTDPTAVVGEVEYGIVPAYWENHTKKSLFQNVNLIDGYGNETKVPYSNVSVISSAFSNRQLKTYDVFYKLSQDAQISRKSKSHNTITNLKAGTVVIGKKSADEDGYVEVCTDNGQVGLIQFSKMEEIMKVPERQPVMTGSGEYKAYNGEVLGIDVNTSGVNLTQLEEILAGTRKRDHVGAIKDTTVNYVYIKMGGYYHDISAHTPLWAEGNEYNSYMGKVVDIIDLCKKYDKQYGFYFYSTAITKEEGKEEAATLNKMISYLKSHGVEAPALPLAIDVECQNNDRQRKIIGNADKVAEASKARSIIFNEVKRENGNYIPNMTIYTNQNATGIASGAEKIIDLDVFADNIDGLKEIPVWWVSSLGSDSSARSGDKVAAKVTPEGKRFKIFGKQILLDKSVQGSFLVDYDIIYEKYYKEFIGKDKASNIVEETTPTQMSSTKSPLNTTMIGYRPTGKTPLYSIGSGRSLGYIDEQTQLIGRMVPDKYGFVSVVTRDGRKGKVKLSNLEAVARNQEQSVQDQDIEDI